MGKKKKKKKKKTENQRGRRGHVPGLGWVRVAIALVSAALYANTLRHQFSFDDNFAVINNPDVDEHAAARGSRLLAYLLQSDFWGQDLRSPTSHKSYRPLTVLSFWQQRALGRAVLGEWGLRELTQETRGSPPAAFHAANVGAHALVAALVYRLALQLAASRRRRFRAAAFSREESAEAAQAALLFAAHPVHTEAVAGVVGHAELLCAALSIAALLAYVAATDGRAAPGPAHWRALIMVLGLAWAAALAKEIGITILGAMAAYDLLVAPAGPRRLRGLRLACAAAAVVGYVWLRSALAGDQLVRIYRKVENPIPFASSSLVRKLTTGYLHARYAGLLLLLPLQLSADWSFACIPYVESLGDPRNLATAALYLCLAYLTLAARPWEVILRLLPWRRGSPAAEAEAEAEVDSGLQAARWRLAVAAGLLVGPFFPTSNVLFYVGTFIGERLLNRRDG